MQRHRDERRRDVVYLQDRVRHDEPGGHVPRLLQVADQPRGERDSIVERRVVARSVEPDVGLGNVGQRIGEEELAGAVEEELCPGALEGWGNVGDLSERGSCQELACNLNASGKPHLNIPAYQTAILQQA